MNATISPGLRSQLLQYALNPLVKTVIQGVETKDPDQPCPVSSEAVNVLESSKVVNIENPVSVEIHDTQRSKLKEYFLKKYGPSAGPIMWNPWNKVVQDHRDGTIDHVATYAVRQFLGLPIPWSPDLAEDCSKGVFIGERYGEDMRPCDIVETKDPFPMPPCGGGKQAPSQSQEPVLNDTNRIES